MLVPAAEAPPVYPQAAPDVCQRVREWRQGYASGCGPAPAAVDLCEQTVLLVGRESHR